MDIVIFVRSLCQIEGSIDYIKDKKYDNVFYLYTNEAFHKNLPNDSVKILANRINLYFIFFKMIFKKFDLVLGDLRWLPKSLRILIFFSKKLITVDDGLSTIWFSEMYKNGYFQFKELHIHSKYLDLLNYPSRLLSRQILNKFNKKFYSGSCCFIGQPIVEIGFINLQNYENILNKLIEHLNLNTLDYYKHPQENKKFFENSKINIIDNLDKNIINIISEKDYSYNFFVTFFSSALIDCYLVNQNIKAKFLFSRNGIQRGITPDMGLNINVPNKIYSLYKKLNFEELAF